MLARSGSFSRRRSRAKEEADPAPKGFVSKIVRSASFSRRGVRHNGGGAAAAEETEREETSSESRSATPDSDRTKCDSPEEVRRHADDADADVSPLQENLFGWLQKRHHRGVNAWARRYFPAGAFVTRQVAGLDLHVLKPRRLHPGQPLDALDQAMQACKVGFGATPLPGETPQSGAADGGLGCFLEAQERARMGADRRSGSRLLAGC